MNVLIQTLVAGILVGGLYGLISSGLSLSFGITRIVNFAHGEFVAIGMYAASVVAVSVTASPFIMVPVAGLLSGLIGSAFYVLFLRRTSIGAASEDEAHTPQIVITFAAGIVIQSLLLMIFSPQVRAITGSFEAGVSIGPVHTTVARISAFVVAVVAFVALDLLVRRTDFGRAFRAIVDDGDAAAIVGINRSRLFAISFGIGTGLAGIAGALLATYTPIFPQAGANYLALAFVTVVLGGLGSIRGAFMAGIVIGIVQQVSATYIAVDLQNTSLWIAFIVILLVKPAGLFGRVVSR